ncbi:MAG TPA: cytochrome b [Casimicrobiaceae bacterium]|nr:cytochrome b [Casimicrobiaceae bacterium]
MVERYNRAAIALHWISALLIIGNLLLGVSMVQLPISPRKLHWYLWHKSVGGTVFLLTSLRLAWRVVRPHPDPVAMPSWQRRASVVSQVMLYLLLLVIPISGWLYSSATGVEVVYLGAIPLPNLVPKDKALADTLRLVHVGLNMLLVAVVCVHVAAALKHHFLDGDAVLARMLPIRKRNPSIP